MVIPILMYHQVSPRVAPAFRKYTVTPKELAVQVRWLAAAGYQSIGLDAVLAHQSGQAHVLPSRPVIITFDDGFADCAEYAVPILQARGFTGTFFLVAGLTGRASRWLAEERGFAFTLLDWPTARALESAGFQCASHTLTHPHLPRLSAAACRAELHGSRCLLEDELGHEVTDLAYPFGDFDQSVRLLAAEAGYRSACSVQAGFVHADDDALALRRIAVNGGDSLLDFICKLHTARPAREWLRTRLTGLVRRHTAVTP